MNKNEKVEQITEIKSFLEPANAVFLVDYHGINVEDISQIRREFLKEGVNYKVFKNTLIKRALQEVGGYDKLEDNLEGMTGVCFADENFVAPAKIIKTYFNKTGKLQFKGCYIESEYYDESKLDVLASMPTKDEVMSSIVGSIGAPASGIVGAINAVISDIVSLVDEISKKKAA